MEVKIRMDSNGNPFLDFQCLDHDISLEADMARRFGKLALEKGIIYYESPATWGGKDKQIHIDFGDI